MGPLPLALVLGQWPPMLALRGLPGESKVISKLKEATQNIKNNFEKTLFPKTFEAKQKRASVKEQITGETLKRREDAIQVYAYVQTKKAVWQAFEVLAVVKKTLGIDDSLIRLSVGIEHIDDIIQDLEQALK